MVSTSESMFELDHFKNKIDLRFNTFSDKDI